MGRRSQVLLVRRRFWELIAEGMSSEDAAAAVGVVGTTGSRWFCRFGGVNPGIKAPRRDVGVRGRLMTSVSRS